jgi:parallel beta-helix repeat protein
MIRFTLSEKNKNTVFFCVLSFFFFFAILGSAESCDNESFDLYNWNDCGGINWHLDSSIGHMSPPSFRSGPIENSGNSCLCLSVKGPATVNFWWKSDTNNKKIGTLSFSINNSRKYVCNSDSWKLESYSLREMKTYTLKWDFVKFRSYPKNVGGGWIDEICIMPKYITNSSDTPVYDPYFIDKESDHLSDQAAMNIDLFSESNVTYVGLFEDPNNHTYKSINEAIQHTSEGGVVNVPRGTYRESIIIYKPLKLIGENKSNTFVVSDHTVIHIVANRVVIKGFTIFGGDLGISALRASDNIIIDNTIALCTKYGIFLEDCVNVSIYNNNIYNIKDSGIFLLDSFGCSIIGNMISDVYLLGISIGGVDGGSYNNTICNNIFVHMIDAIKISSDSNWNLIGDEGKRNSFKNINGCDIYLTNTDKTMNLLPSTCKSDGKGCEKCL